MKVDKVDIFGLTSPASFISYAEGSQPKNDQKWDSIFGLKLFFNTAHTLFICPFYLSGVTAETFTLRTKWWHKLICILYTVIGTIWLLGEIRLAIPTSDRRNPATYFKMVGILVDTIFKVTMLNQFWWKQTDILNILRFLGTIGGDWKLSKKQSCTRNKPKFIFIFVFVFFLALNTIFWASGHATQSPSWNLRSLWKGIVKRGRFNFFVKSTNTTPNRWDLDIMFGCLSIIGHYQRRTWGTLTDLFIMTIVLTLYQLVDNFVEQLQVETKWVAVRGEYRKLTTFCELINSFIATNTACMLTFMIVSMATGLHQFFFSSIEISILERIFLLIYIVISLTILHGCSSICQQVGKL